MTVPIPAPFWLTTVAVCWVAGSPPGLVMGMATGRKVSPQPTSSSSDATMAAKPAFRRKVIQNPMAKALRGEKLIVAKERLRPAGLQAKSDHKGHEGRTKD